MCPFSSRQARRPSLGCTDEGVVYLERINRRGGCGQKQEALHQHPGPTSEAAQPGDDYYFSEKVDGSKHFGIWPLAQAAQACFGTSDWPADRPAPQVSIEFEVESEAAVEHAGQELESHGFKLVHPSRKEPWGQVIARLLSDEGAIIGISYTPWMHPGQG